MEPLHRVLADAAGRQSESPVAAADSAATLEAAGRSSDFDIELESLLNRHCMENGSNTPDFILAQYMKACLAAFNSAVVHRERWYGKKEG